MPPFFPAFPHPSLALPPIEIEQSMVPSYPFQVRPQETMVLALGSLLTFSYNQTLEYLLKLILEMYHRYISHDSFLLITACNLRC
jgi:hypothetical protein